HPHPLYKLLSRILRDGNQRVCSRNCFTRPLQCNGYSLGQVKLRIGKKTQIVDRHHQLFTTVVESRSRIVRAMYHLDLSKEPFFYEPWAVTIPKYAQQSSRYGRECDLHVRCLRKRCLSIMGVEGVVKDWV